MTLSTYTSLFLRVFRTTRITSAFCAGDIVCHNSTIYHNYSHSCKQQYHQLVSKSFNCCQKDHTTSSCNEVKQCCNDLEPTYYSQQDILSSLRNTNQSSHRVPFMVNKFNSARCTRSSGSFLEQSTAFYHHSSVSHAPSPSKLRTVNSLSHPSLLRLQNIFQSSQPGISSFSPTKLILESSPFSIQPYLRLIRFDKPIGSWLLYWPCTWSIALAADPGCLPDLRILALFGAGAFFMRGAGCIINDMWDKDIDAKVERTRMRPLAAGEITQFKAVVFLGVQLSCALAILLQLNTYSILLGAASMGLVITYPLFKRFTYWPQLILGFTFNYGALLGWAAVRGSVDWMTCLPLYFSCIMWTIIYDTIYAHQDKYDDMLIGIKSTAILFGDQTKPFLSVFAAIMTSGLTVSGYLCDMTWPYYLIVGLTGSKLAHQIYSVNLNNADECSQAFRGNFYLGAIMFAGIVLANLLRPKEELKTEIEGSRTELMTESGKDEMVNL